ncbi:transporter substrate-binding domain-containing protein [Streptomyces spectabilis]|uniref:ABC transporter substrate-binding protein n=1 Tax=Streptomyces spectabilis TaxID=68270 RepID=A0A5P2XCF6_STRST|nr:transporter substrate-binding domain-containing protein [Streptomyces spectabilis]MBB5104540.1 polar amino acid transport system substrate-binding protein [Streptomyces spectabilis]MCI3905105.1 transporter substrate-binding domain-containing protein [Streptomyces spectabilis]QEV62121.1 ABC transporter substrate-binding protein [Streptomyces spectabilis]GGV00622.1 ABC transporter substrate-binding protein [Streptomyces spectabilis]
MTTIDAEISRGLAPDGVLRASINLGNPVLAQGSAEEPAGVTVELAREVAARLGVPVRFLCFDAARKSYAAMAEGRADLCFLAVDPDREEEVAFSAPYVHIEGAYAVPVESSFVSAADVDQDGVRIGVKKGSAYDLYLSRALRYAAVVRGDEGVGVFHAEGLEVAAGIRQPLAAHVARHDGLRLLEPAFMTIRQAMGTPKERGPKAAGFLSELVGELVASGFVADALRRSGQDPALAAPVAAV